MLGGAVGVVVLSAMTGTGAGGVGGWVERVATCRIFHYQQLCHHQYYYYCPHRADAGVPRLLDNAVHLILGGVLAVVRRDGQHDLVVRLEAVEEGALEEELVLDVVAVVLEREEAEELVRVVEGTDDARHTGQRHVDTVRSLGTVHDVHCKYC